MALTKYNYNSFNVTPVASKALAFNSGANGLTTAAEGSMVLIKTLTASSDSTLEFVDGTDDVVLDNTYPTYVIKWINIHGSTDRFKFSFQGNAAGGSGYNETMTTSWWQAYHDEADSNTALTYVVGEDQAQGTAFQSLSESSGTDNDQNVCGELWLFNPSSTTFVKHFLAKCHDHYYSDYKNHIFVAGYFNTTSAIDEIQLKLTTGNMDAGTIKLYGIKDS